MTKITHEELIAAVVAVLRDELVTYAKDYGDTHKREYDSIEEKDYKEIAEALVEHVPLFKAASQGLPRVREFLNKLDRCEELVWEDIDDHKLFEAAKAELGGVG